MDLKDILTAEGVLPALNAPDKAHLMAALAEAGARVTGLKSKDILAAISKREALGSTGLGRGIAVPHGRLATLTRMHCVFARVRPAVEYDSVDGERVDLVFMLIGPEAAGADHLKALARIARLMREPETARQLRAASDRQTILTLLTGTSQPLSRTG